MKATGVEHGQNTADRVKRGMYYNNLLSDK
jgi:hypothetical protein